uniref:Uncharacterized protein n=1 Tax=Denticeps clupeoides TaxID=299321 RepID=A0AAY4EIP2_9TELE
MCPSRLFRTLKTQQEQNKTLSNANVSKSSPACHGSKRGLENKDPSVAGRLKGVSRLPVLAKSLQHPTTAEAALGVTQMKWEQRPLLVGSCTRGPRFYIYFIYFCHLPDSLVQSTLQSVAASPWHLLCSQGRLHSAKRPRSGATTRLLRGYPLPGTWAPAPRIPITLQVSSVLQQRMLEKKIPDTYDQNAFSLDPGALCSILQSEGAGLTPLRSACSSGRNTSNFLVSVSRNASPFTPDPAALRSILQNEGIGAGTVAGANISACPSARTTSVYSVRVFYSPTTHLVVYNIEQSIQIVAVKTLNPEAESESHFQKRLEKGEKPSTQGPFVQAAHRASVIVFRSASKQLGDTPARAVGSEVTFTSAEPLNPVVLCHQRVMALRRRLPALGEMLLDEECSTYTSRPQSGPALPRCPNPIAVTLLFQDSTCFVPIGPGCCTLQSPASFHSSPIRA